MGIYGNASKIKKIPFDGGEKIKYVYYGSTKLWSDSHIITFVEGSVSTTVEYDDGATVSRSTAPSGATFVGWSQYSDGRSPVSSFVATEPGTWYRVVKYNDVQLNYNWEEESRTVARRRPTAVPIPNIDMSKYGGINITYYVDINGNGSTGDVKAYISCDQDTRLVGHAYNISHGSGDYDEYPYKATSSANFAFISNSGTTDLRMWISITGYGGEGSMVIRTASLIGRQAVG